MRKGSVVNVALAAARASVPQWRVRKTSTSILRFDTRALYQALDEKRKARELSWREVANEIGVSVSTRTRTQRGGRLEVDAMLAMVDWLGVSVESFVREASQ